MPGQGWVALLRLAGPFLQLYSAFFIFPFLLCDALFAVRERFSSQ